MAKYRKKPVVIEAFQYGEETIPRWFEEREESFILDEKGNASFESDKEGRVHMKIETLEGTMIAEKGDYVIRGVKGEIYPCKADIFNLTYERVENER